jgi:hypothetical protein
MSGYIGNKPLSKVTGVFTPNQQYDLVRSNNWGESDPFWDDVVLLLQPVTGATSIEDLSQSNHSITNNGVTLDSSNEKWTGAPSMLFEASNSDRLELPDSDDWYLDNLDFTLEWFDYFNSIGPNDRQGIMGQRFGKNDWWGVRYVNDFGGLTFSQESAGNNNINVEEGSAYTNTGVWQHNSIVRLGNTFYIFRGGSLLSTKSNAQNILQFNGSFYVGWTNPDSDEYFDGNMTSLRITKGVARYTSNFTPPTRPFPTR